MTRIGNTSQSRYDALVVGARCAGAATAMLLARRGLRVLAVDRGHYGADTISTHALMRGAVLQLGRWGLLDAVKAAGTPAVRQATFDYGAEAATVPIQPGGGVEALYAPRRTVLDPILVDAARAAGAEVRFGTVVTELLRAPDGRVKGAVIVGRDGTVSEIAAAIVIGADGVRSNVAEMAGAQTLAQGRAASALVFGYFTGVANPGYHWMYRPGMIGGSIPTGDGTHCVFVGTPAGSAGTGPAESPEARFRNGLAAMAPELAAALAGRAPQGRLRIFGGIPGHLRQAQGPGWALVGDAGYFKDPATAHGITDAFRDAELLARAVAAGHAQALEDYQHLRDALSLPLFGVTDAIARYDWTLDQLKIRLAALNEAMRTEFSVLSAIGARDPAPAVAAAPRGEEMSAAL